MKFVLASYGSRGDVQPCIALSCELVRRGHEVQLAVAPDVVSFVESVGLSAVAYGVPTRPWQDIHREFLATLFSNFWKVRSLTRLWRKDWKLLSQCQEDMLVTLKSLSSDADLLLTGILGEEAALNVADYYDIPLATLHFAPVRPSGAGQSGRLLSTLQRSTMRMFGWFWYALTKRFDDAQRAQLSLPKTPGSPMRRIFERRALEIQAYDKISYPGLVAEWASLRDRRPFVGALTTDLATDFDEQVLSWIDSGSPPIYFGFGSIPVSSPSDALAMISAACAELGERALVCSGWTEFSDVQRMPHVNVVGALNHSAVLPKCRAVVHHGGAGTTAAGLRAGVPTLILSTWPEQAQWGAQVKRLKVGTARGFSTATRETIVADLRTILAPEYVARARDVAVQMTKPADSVKAAADLLEDRAEPQSVT